MLSLHNMAASSGLRKNVYPINFSLQMFIFIILLVVLLSISTDVKSYTKVSIFKEKIIG